MLTWLTARRAFAAIVLIVVAALAAALYLQHVEGLQPCPLCVMQRAGLVGTAVAALAAALFARSPTSLRVMAAVAALPALGGGGVAAWHAWIKVYPPESMSCGRPFEWFHRDFPLAKWLPRLFRGDGDCLAETWTLLGLNLAQWSLAVFVLLLALLWMAARRPPPRAR